MKVSRYPISTLRETPADAEIASHQLLLRAGYIRQVASGLYNWMPIGLRVLQSVTAIIREEMNRAGALEVLMPVVQPAELWHESGRWAKYDEGQLLKFKDRNERDFCFGPTHEEVITDLARQELKSHRQLPINFYQIQTKFRDETRPRFGLMRAREFMMKDAYSFHLDQASLQQTYDDMHDAYSRIMQRCGLDFRPVHADTGSIGGSASMEFMALADTGEDTIAFSTTSSYAANIELAEALAPEQEEESGTPTERVPTPGDKTIEDVRRTLGLTADRTVKTLIVEGTDSPAVALVLRGDHKLNELKAEKLDAVAAPLRMLEPDAVKAVTGVPIGSIGPAGLTLPLIADRSAAALGDFVCGANEEGFHTLHVNWSRDVGTLAVADLRDVVEGDPSPDGQGQIALKRGIEVGHIFQLGTIYSEALGATVLDDSGKAVTMTMGCYGIGVSRIVAAIIEQHHDDKGMLWPRSVTPFEVMLIPINAHKSADVQSASVFLYNQMLDAGINVLLDDRDRERPGAKFADAELLGIPQRVIVGDRGLKSGAVEVVDRATGETSDVALDQVVTHLQGALGAQASAAS